jgi:uncharacterized protein with ParB-like and HNH nuclease domain
MTPDIANKIEASDKSLSEILQADRRYEIDYFQREYRWQRKHVEDLISDITGSFFTNYQEGHTLDDELDYNRYYMGPIVIYGKSGGALSIVDGQQRLTSLTLLITYLHHLQNHIVVEEDDRPVLKGRIFHKRGRHRSLVLDVESRTPVIEHLYNHPTEAFDGDLEDESVQNILDRYQDITTLFPLELKTNEILPIFIEWLLKKIVLVEIKAFSSQNAYTIFETMNDRGLNLSPTEMLKSYLLAKAENEERIKDLNGLWKTRIAELRSEYGSDADQDFFKAWLRAKYAEKVRKGGAGAENEDFENIGTRFHSWVREKEKKLKLKAPEDFYFFVKADFDFYTNIYKKVMDYQWELYDEAPYAYLSSFYKIADSLSYPLYISPITKNDSEESQNEKINLIGRFIDVYTTYRTLKDKSITQSSIRNAMYELIKSVRNQDIDDLKEELALELAKTIAPGEDIFTEFQPMNNWGYYHYFFARIWHHLGHYDNGEMPGFQELMRSKRRKSLVLYRFILEGEMTENIEPQLWEIYLNSVSSFCLVRRHDLDDINEMTYIDRIAWLLDNGYLPEMEGVQLSSIQYPSEFIIERSTRLKPLVSGIWNID